MAGAEPNMEPSARFWRIPVRTRWPMVSRSNCAENHQHSGHRPAADRGEVEVRVEDTDRPPDAAAVAGPFGPFEQAAKSSSEGGEAVEFGDEQELGLEAPPQPPARQVL